VYDTLIVRAFGTALYDPDNSREYTLDLTYGLQSNRALDARAVAAGRAAALAYSLGAALGKEQVRLDADMFSPEVRMGLTIGDLTPQEEVLLASQDLNELADFVLAGAQALAYRSVEQRDIIERIGLALEEGMRFHFTAGDVFKFIVEGTPPQIRLSEHNTLEANHG
jgi:hypothetical protein